MDIRDPRFDALSARMRAAFEGETRPWQAVSAAMRDAMVAHAAERSPYYAARIDADIPFEDLPVLTKASLSEHFNELFAAGVPEDRRIRVTTSGSTGQPLTCVRDLSQGPAEEISARNFLLWMEGIPQGLTNVWFASRPPQRTGVYPMPGTLLHPEAIAEHAQRWADEGPYMLYGYASAIDWTAGLVEDGLELPELPTACVATGEMLTEPMRERIGRVFGAVHSWYGSQEVGGFVAGSLPGSSRMACNPLLGWVEILDEDDRPVAPGQRGRVVVTDLNNWVFPMIRYDTEDLAVAGGEFIGGFPVIESLLGRASDRLTLASGRTMSGVGFGGTVFVKNELVPFVHAWQLAQTGPDALELRVVWREEPTAELIARTTAAAREMADASTSVTVISVPELERTEAGKTWLVRKGY